MNDYGVDQNQNLLQFPLYKADFFNTIIYGNNDDELEFDFEFGTATHNFSNLLLRGTISTPSSNFTNVIKNQDPRFFDVFEDDYHINSNSPARDAGDPAFVTPDIQTDLDGNPRLIDAGPDLGVYEFL